jgi:hypothetical protein
LTSSGTAAGIGYATGAGFSVIQATSKSTAVTINNISGQITMFGNALGSTASVSFIVNNTTVDATDVPVVAISGGTTFNYLISVNEVGTDYFRITVRNVSGASRSEELVINFAIIKAVAN